MTTEHDPYIRSKEHYQDPPNGILATLKQVGPGMILVGGVVGSGELIVTTKQSRTFPFPRLTWNQVPWF